MRDLHCHLDQYLASQGLAPAQHGEHGSLLFHTRDGLWMGACAMADGRLRLFACPGRAPAAWRRGLREDGAADGPDAAHDAFDRLERDVVVRWRACGVDWSVAVEPASGAMTLSLLLADGPRQPDTWSRCLAMYAQQFDDWQGRCPDEAPLPAQGTGGFARLLSTGLLLPG